MRSALREEAAHVALLHFVFLGVGGEAVVVFGGGGGEGGQGECEDCGEEGWEQMAGRAAVVVVAVM